MILENLPIFSKKLNLSQTEIDDIKEKIKNYRVRFPKSNISNVKAWHSDWNTDLIDNSFRDINFKIISECKKFISNQIKNDIEIEICNMWINIYEKGNFSREHNHHPFDISCCYYIDIEKNASPIEFPHLKIIPENDLLIIFSGSLPHKIAPTNGKRTLITMNLNCKIKTITYY